MLKFFLYVMFFCAGAMAQGHWEVVTHAGNRQLSRMSFVDAQTGWAVGFGGTIFKTSDGGFTWENQSQELSENIEDVFMLDADTGYAVAPVFNQEDGTRIFKTTDGGQNWESTLYPGRYFFTAHFFDANSGWIAGLQGAFAKTTDGGQTWREVFPDTAIGSFFPIRNINFYSRQLGVAVGGQYDRFGVVWQTVDGGESWQAHTITSEPFFDVSFIDSLNFLVVGGDLEWGASRAFTTDGGETWEVDSLRIYGVARAIAFRTAQEVWAPLAISEGYMVSTDRGLSWTDGDMPENSVVLDMMFFDSTSGIGVGEEGVVVRYVHDPVAIEPEPDIPAQDFFLAGNFPNPFNPQTQIRFHLGSPGQVKLTVYNIAGEVVRRQEGDFGNAGWHAIAFDGAAVASGIYLYRVEFVRQSAPALLQTGKMVLLK
ncbi:MAG TPA: YCF48-related protein [Calditrichia bacterium]|nr:YCF48-related protein [Calditrichia bacterium]